MKFLIFFLALIVSLVGFTSAQGICAHNHDTGKQVNFESIKAMNKANSESSNHSEYLLLL